LVTPWFYNRGIPPSNELVLLGNFILHGLLKGRPHSIRYLTETTELSFAALRRLGDFDRVAQAHRDQPLAPVTAVDDGIDWRQPRIEARLPVGVPLNFDAPIDTEERPIEIMAGLIHARALGDGEAGVLTEVQHLKLATGALVAGSAAAT
jgi:hypothetical protein